MTTQTAIPQQYTAQAQPEPYGPIVLRLHPAVELTEEQFVELCSLNELLRIERNAQGDLEILPPNSITSSSQNSDVSADLKIWARSDGSGAAFDSSVGFTLPNRSVRSPDASWVLKSRLAGLTEEQKRYGFPPITPDFVIELRSSSDTLRSQQRKMEEYIANGAKLGWLIDPLGRRQRVYVYRPGADVEVFERPESLSGDPELPGFTLDLQPVWEPGF